MKKIASSNLSARTMALADPTLAPLSTSIFTRKGSPPAEEGVIAARNVLATEVSSAYLNDIFCLRKDESVLSLKAQKNQKKECKLNASKSISGFA
jgi:hypothetical protein